MRLAKFVAGRIGALQDVLGAGKAFPGVDHLEQVGIGPKIRHVDLAVDAAIALSR